MRNIGKIGVCCLTTLLFCLIWGQISFGKSVSDINIKAFDDLSGKQEVPSDPFAPTKPSLKSVSVQDIQLTGLVLNEDEAYALVDGFMVQAGDMIADYKVVAINNDNIVVRKLDDVKVIHLTGGL